MEIIGQISSNLSESERLVVILGVVGLAACAAWKWIGNLLKTQPTPDPWDDQTLLLDNADALPICHYCLKEHDALVNFCPHCGAAVGTYTNLMPPLYLYSIGDVFRAGTEGTYRRSRFLNGGFFFASFVAYALVTPLFFLVPIYWFKLLKNASAQNSGGIDPEPPANSES